MEAEVYPESRVTSFINENFIPLRRHVRDSADVMQRFEVEWTPTILILDSEGRARHRIEGFLPADDFLAQLKLGLGQVQMAAKRFTDAERVFHQVVQELPATDAAPAAQYWAGVSRYKGSNDPKALKETAEAFKKRYTDSEWAKKASVWN